MTAQQNTELDKILESIKGLQFSQAETDRFLSKRFAETDKQMKETDKQMKETEKFIKSLSVESKETNIQMKETDRKFKELGIHVNGISKSQGLEAEEFFHSSLEKNPYLGSMKFDYIDRNKMRTVNGDDLEIDIFLENGKSVGLVEVKNKVTKKSLKQLEKNMKRFHKYYPVFKNYKAYGAIAGKIFPKELETLALKKGFFVLKQQGDHIEVKSPFTKTNV